MSSPEVFLCLCTPGVRRAFIAGYSLFVRATLHAILVYDARVKYGVLDVLAMPFTTTDQAVSVIDRAEQNHVHTQHCNDVSGKGRHDARIHQTILLTMLTKVLLQLPPWN